jgi:DNA-binding NarL/FixJ family response regulator
VLRRSPAQRRSVSSRTHGLADRSIPTGLASTPSLDRLATLFPQSCVLRARLQAAGVCPVDCRKCLHRCAWSVNPHRSASTGSALDEQLTRRAVSILKRLESVLSNKEIAEAIFVSEGTLKWHLHSVYSKLNVKNRPGAMARARTLGIV